MFWTTEVGRDHPNSVASRSDSVWDLLQIYNAQNTWSILQHHRKCSNNIIVSRSKWMNLSNTVKVQNSNTLPLLRPLFFLITILPGKPAGKVTDESWRNTKICYPNFSIQNRRATPRSWCIITVFILWDWYLMNSARNLIRKKFLRSLKNAQFIRSRQYFCAHYGAE